MTTWIQSQLIFRHRNPSPDFPSLKDQRGQGLTEYLVLILLIAVLSIAAVRSLGGTIRSKIQLAQRHINSDVSLEDQD